MSSYHDLIVKQVHADRNRAIQPSVASGALNEITMADLAGAARAEDEADETCWRESARERLAIWLEGLAARLRYTNLTVR